MDPQEAARARGKTKTAPTRSELELTKGGGAYIPPARLRMMQQAIEDKSSPQYVAS